MLVQCPARLGDQLGGILGVTKRRFENGQRGQNDHPEKPV